jgi:hypothetical protein
MDRCRDWVGGRTGPDPRRDFRVGVAPTGHSAPVTIQLGVRREFAIKIIGSFPRLLDPRDRPARMNTEPLRTAFLASFDAAGASNGGTVAIDGLIELHRRIAPGFKTETTIDCACSSYSRRLPPTGSMKSPLVIGRLVTSRRHQRPGSARRRDRYRWRCRTGYGSR